MLFNSYLFIFCFLPIVWAVFHILKALSIRQAREEYRKSKQVESSPLYSKSLESKVLESSTLNYKRLNPTSYKILLKAF